MPERTVTRAKVTPAELERRRKVIAAAAARTTSHIVELRRMDDLAPGEEPAGVKDPTTH